MNEGKAISDGDGVSPADEIRADIEQTRAELADTVDALADKLDVKARAADKVADAKARVGAAVERARPYRKQIAVAALAGLVALVIVRNRRG